MASKLRPQDAESLPEFWQQVQAFYDGHDEKDVPFLVQSAKCPRSRPVELAVEEGRRPKLGTGQIAYLQAQDWSPTYMCWTIQDAKSGEKKIVRAKPGTSSYHLFLGLQLTSSGTHEPKWSPGAVAYGVPNALKRALEEVEEHEDRNFEPQTSFSDSGPSGQQTRMTSRQKQGDNDKVHATGDNYHQSSRYFDVPNLSIRVQDRDSSPHNDLPNLGGLDSEPHPRTNSLQAAERLAPPNSRRSVPSLGQGQARSHTPAALAARHTSLDVVARLKGKEVEKTEKTPQTQRLTNLSDKQLEETMLRIEMPMTSDDRGPSWPILVQLRDVLSSDHDINKFFSAIMENLGKEHEHRKIDILFVQIKCERKSGDVAETWRRNTIDRSVPRSLDNFLRDIKAAPTWNMSPSPELEIIVKPKGLKYYRQNKSPEEFVDSEDDDIPLSKKLRATK